MTDIESYISFTRRVCETHNWKKDWSHGGCYMHLEVSEFIEALRGKGDPLEELGDVLFTIMAVADYHGIDPVEALKNNIEKHTRIIDEMEK